MATSALAVLSLAAVVATFGAAMAHGSTTTLEITASDKDTGSWLAKMGDTKVAVEHKHLEGNVGSGEWTLKLSQSSDLENNDISEDRILQQRETTMDDSPDQSMGNQMVPQQDSYLFSPSAGVPGPSTWGFQQRTLPDTLTPPGVYQDPSYFPAPDTMLRPPPALPPYSYNMMSRQTQPMSYSYAPSLAPNRIQRGFMAAPSQSYNTLRYASEFPSYNAPAYDPTFEVNRLERTYGNDMIQPNMAQQPYLSLWQAPEPGVMTLPVQQDVPQQDSYMPAAFAGQQNYFPQNEPRGQVPINAYQYTAVIIPNAEELSSENQNTGKTEYSSEVPSGIFNNPDTGMMNGMQNQRFETGMHFQYAPNSMLDSMNAAPKEEQTISESNGQTQNAIPEHQFNSGYAPEADTEQKYVIVEALVVPNSETVPAQELSRDTAQQPLSYSPNFSYNEEIEGLKPPQPLPLLVNERMQDAPKLISDFSAPSYGMTPPPRLEQRNPNENEVMPEYKEVQDYHPYIADIAFRPNHEADRAISYMPTSILKQDEASKVDTTTPDVEASSEKQK